MHFRNSSNLTELANTNDVIDCATVLQLLIYRNSVLGLLSIWFNISY